MNGYPLQDIQSPSCNHSCQTAEMLTTFCLASMITGYRCGKTSMSNYTNIKSSTPSVISSMILLTFGLYTGWSQPTNIMLHHLLHDIQALYDQQENLGWKQIYYGQFPHFGLMYCRPTIHRFNGVTYYTKCLTLIWQAVIKVWQIQNQHLHPRSYEQEDCSMLKAAVHQIFHKAMQDPIFQEMIDTLSLTRSSAVPLVKLDNG